MGVGRNGAQERMHGVDKMDTQGNSQDFLGASLAEAITMNNVVFFERCTTAVQFELRPDMFSVLVMLLQEMHLCDEDKVIIPGFKLP